MKRTAPSFDLNPLPFLIFHGVAVGIWGLFCTLRVCLCLPEFRWLNYAIGVPSTLFFIALWIPWIVEYHRWVDFKPERLRKEQYERWKLTY